MALNPGTRLGPYEVVGAIGAGGMGEVYRARDTKLDRDVALKVLPPTFTDDPDRIARFEREARALASLNHPHIAQIYGLEGDGSPASLRETRPLAIVMELVPGEDLAARISRGPVPLDEALAIARQVADALDAAHERSIVHRDLKPANIKVTPDGTVKVLDFGLAKAVAGPEDSTSGSNVANSPTLTARATQMGMILGTAAYMAPEQAKGRPVDRRADIWAFGAVLFEMLAGRRAFEGDDVSETLASVIKGEAHWEGLPADLPPAVRRLLERCLQKDPKRRLRDIAEGMLQLDDGLLPSVPESAAVMPAAPAAPLWRRALPVAAAVAVTAAVTYVLTMARTPAPPPADAVSFTVSLKGLTQQNRAASIALSDDGRQLAYLSLDRENRRYQVYVRPLDQLSGVPVAGTENAAAPFFSPDGQWLGFVDSTGLRTLRKVPVGGGASTLIAESPQAIAGADWGPDDVIIFGTASGLFKVPADGGVPEAITTAEEPVTFNPGYRWPSFVPGAGIVLFTAPGRETASLKLAAVTLSTGVVTDLGIDGTQPRYLPTGHIVFATVDGALRAVPFDVSTLTVTGSVVPLVTGVAVGTGGAANVSVADSGTLVYMPGTGGLERPLSLVWVDREGRESPIAAEPRPYTYPRISPDGQRVAVEVRGDEEDVWIWDFGIESLRRLTTDPAPDQYPVWTPDGLRVVWGSRRDNQNGVYIQDADGTGQAEQLATSDVELSPNAMLPDGSGVVVRTFTTLAADTNLAFVPLDVPGDVRTLLGTPFGEANASLSPDGRWIAYQDGTTGRAEVMVRPFPSLDDGSWQISTRGGREPVWSPGGRAVFYLGSDDVMMSVAVTTVPAFAHQPPQPLFDASAYVRNIGRNYDIAPDGRFLMIKPPETEAESALDLVFVLNWLDEVKARVRPR